jgi:hypothetical protein
MFDLEEALSRDRARWGRALEACKYSNKHTREIFRKTTEFIREQNEKKYREMMDEHTPPGKAWAIWCEFITEAFLLGIIGEVDRNNPLIKHRHCEHEYVVSSEKDSMGRKKIYCRKCGKRKEQ